MGTAALSDDEVIDALIADKRTTIPDHEGIRVECASRRIELTGGANINSPQISKRRELISERDTKINDSLPAELRDKYTRYSREEV